MKQEQQARVETKVDELAKTSPNLAKLLEAKKEKESKVTKQISQKDLYGGRSPGA